MRLKPEGSLDLSPSDLTTFTACAHASRLDIDAVVGRPVPERGRDPDADLLAELGRRHEGAYLDHLRAQGLEVETIGALEDPDEARARLLELMRAGVDVIAQAPLRDGAWRGVADVLRRVEGASALGAFHYEVEDTKLATTTRAATVLQLLTYARMLERLQGVPGEYVHVVAPGVAPDPFARTSLRVEDYDAVTGRATRRFEAFAGAAVAGEARTVPEPVDHCAVCGWWASCRARWRDQDHLSLVANLGGARRAELERHGVDTRRALAERRHGIGFKPEYGRTEAYL
nr:nuclease [Gemmatimonadaceae bacterium]